MKRYVFSIIINILCSCCLLNSNDNDIEKTIQEWQGKEIVLSLKMQFKTLGRDTLCSDLF